jgi:excisionase family DNA binding protein
MERWVGHVVLRAVVVVARVAPRMAVLSPFAARYILARAVESERARNVDEASHLAAARLSLLGRPRLAREVREGYAQLRAAAADWRDETSDGGNAEVPRTGDVAHSKGPPESGMTTRQVAEVVGVGARQVTNLCRAGHLSASLVGGMWVIDRCSVEEYVAAKGVGRGHE